jgi:hypothetical protein
VHGSTASGTAVLILAVTSNVLAQTNDQFYRSWRWSADQAPARVAGLAGAFVAVADDSAAVLFNPAGLVQLQKTELLGGVLVRASGTTASSAGDRLRAVTGVGFAGGAGALSPRWRIGGYIVQPQDRRSDMAALRLPDGTVTAGFLDTQVTEVGGSAAWELTSSFSLGARVTATHLKLEGEEQRTGPVELEVGSAAGETRVTGSFGGLLTLGRRLRIGASGQPGAAYRVRRTANRAGQLLDPGSEYDLRQPGLPRLVPGVAETAWLRRWSADGHSLFLVEIEGRVIKVFRRDLASGRRELLKEITPADPAGVFGLRPVIAADGKSYAYNYWRYLSNLYLVEGLR